MISELERYISWVDSAGRPLQRVTEYFEAINRQVNANTILEGSGSPEGVLAADPKTLYMDTAGTAGNILYIKKTGTGNTGWIGV